MTHHSPTVQYRAPLASPSWLSVFSGLLGALVNEGGGVEGERGGAEAGSGQKAVLKRQAVHSFFSTRGAFDLQRAELGPA